MSKVAIFVDEQGVSRKVNGDRFGSIDLDAAVRDGTIMSITPVGRGAIYIVRNSGDLTTAVTGPPPKSYDFKTCVIGGSRSPH